MIELITKKAIELVLKTDALLTFIKLDNLLAIKEGTSMVMVSGQLRRGFTQEEANKWSQIYPEIIIKDIDVKWGRTRRRRNLKGNKNA